MDYEHDETSYEKERKRSDHRLRRIPKEEHSRLEADKKEGKLYDLEGYEPSEQERKEKSEPREQLLFRGKNQRFSAGYNKDKKLTMVFSRDKNDSEVKDQEIFKKEGSSAMKQDKKYLRSGTHNPKKGAVVLEDREEKRKQFLIGRLKEVMDAKGDMLLDESFSFISGREEKEQIHSLEEEARACHADRQLVEKNRKQASALYQDLIFKEQERRDFMKNLFLQVTPKETEKKRGRFFPAFALGLISLLAAGEEGDGAAGEKEKGAAGAEKPKPEESKKEDVGQNREKKDKAADSGSGADATV